MSVCSSSCPCTCTFEYDSDTGEQHLEPCASCESQDARTVPFYWDIEEAENALSAAAAEDESEIEEHRYLQAFVTLFRGNRSACPGDARACNLCPGDARVRNLDHTRLTGAIFRYLRTRPVFMATTPAIRDDIPAQLDSFMSRGFPEEEADLMRVFLAAIKWRADYVE